MRGCSGGTRGSPGPVPPAPSPQQPLPASPAAPAAWESSSCPGFEIKHPEEESRGSLVSQLELPVKSGDFSLAAISIRAHTKAGEPLLHSDLLVSAGKQEISRLIFHRATCSQEAPSSRIYFISQSSAWMRQEFPAGRGEAPALRSRNSCSSRLILALLLHQAALSGAVAWDGCWLGPAVTDEG